MLGLLLIYFIWKKFADLAFEFDKNRWLFGILGVISYYASYYLSAFITGILIGVFNPDLLNSIAQHEILFGILIIPFGILGMYGLFVILRKNWTNAKDVTGELIDQ
jgi:hypothetical protein